MNSQKQEISLLFKSFPYHYLKIALNYYYSWN